MYVEQITFYLMIISASNWLKFDINFIAGYFINYCIYMKYDKYEQFANIWNTLFKNMNKIHKKVREVLLFYLCKNVMTKISIQCYKINIISQVIKSWSSIKKIKETCSHGYFYVIIFLYKSNDNSIIMCEVGAFYIFQLSLI